MTINSRTDTLSTYLVSSFFIDNQNDFQIIYDRLAILKAFFETEKANHENKHILIIDSTESPSEFLLRDQIASDFDNSTGWYKHIWIIYIHGQFTNNIEAFDSFLYYSRIGKHYKFESLADILFTLPNNPLSSKKGTFILETISELNEIIFPQFLSVPLNCFITKTGELSEAAIWMGYLSFLADEFRLFQDISPIWNEKVITGKLFTIEDVVLELIRFNNPADSYSTDEIPSFFDKLLNYVFTSLKTEQLVNSTLSDDEKLKRLVLSLFQSAAKFKVKKKEKKGASLESYFTDAKKEVKKLASKIVTSWVNHSDRLLLKRFQQWMEILRKELPPIIINEEILVEYQNSFSFTGMIDIALMNYLLENQVQSNATIREWNTTIQEVMKTRKALWIKYGRLWWEQNQIFQTPTHSTSMKEIWHTIIAIGRIFSYKFDESLSWEQLESQAWKIEKNSFNMLNPKTADMINNLESFQNIKKQYIKAIIQYEDLIHQFNNKFTDYYLNQLINKPDLLIVGNVNKIFEDTIERIKNNEEIGIIFCDALRKDLSMFISSHLQTRFQKAKKIVKKFDIQTIPSFTYIPSNTAIGWNAILSHSGKISYRLANNDVELLFNDDSGKPINLRTREDREKQLTKILTQSGKSIEILPLHPRNIFTELHQYREKIISNKSIDFIPIVWYSKIDDHNKTRDDFFENINDYLTELEEIIFQFHINGVNNVYIFVDHGFTFVKDEHVLAKDNKPKGDLHLRYCLSDQHYSKQEILKFNNWCIIDPGIYNIQVSVDPEKVINSIITPRGYKTFNKIRSKTKFIHGGLSFQESSINFIQSYCEMYPSVKVESFEPYSHPSYPDSEGDLIYELKKFHNFNFLELRVKGSEPIKGEKHKPLKIKLICDNHLVEVDPKTSKNLKSGDVINFKLSFPDKITISEVTVSVIDSQNLLLAKRVFKLQPILYSAGFEDF